MITRNETSKAVELNLVGSSVFGRYPKVSIEKSLNLFESDNWMVGYAGYQIGISSTQFNDGVQGRAIFSSIKLGKLVVVIDSNVYLVEVSFNQQSGKVINQQVEPVGQLQTAEGVVYVVENNKPQILISDNTSLYIYDPTLSPVFQVISTNFIPGYITFHDTYFIAAASQDTYSSSSNPANNTWRLSMSNDGTSWPSTAAYVGLLETKPDNVKAVVRFPSQGNMIFVMGSNVTESWFDTGAQLFPYQRNNQYNIDYGCLSPATVAYMDTLVVWLAANEKSGPIILYSEGGQPEKITTDGIDYLFSQLQNPQDSQAFIYRQDGHLFYHINFYSDNLSLYIDFNTKKIYNACDQNYNYFIASEVAFFNNQYYFVTKNNGNLFAFDTVYTTYQDVDADGVAHFYEIPRGRICRNIRLPSQEYFIINDVGFTIESGETNYQREDAGPLFLITEDDKYLITEGGAIFFVTELGDYLETEDGNLLISQQSDADDFSYLIAEQDNIIQFTPRVDLSISYDGGATFGNEWGYELPAIGKRRNRLMWWQCGAGNDIVCQFKFWGIGRFVVTDGVVNIRQ